jgi:dolichol-phosphate mannosyltransferase
VKLGKLIKFPIASRLGLGTILSVHVDLSVVVPVRDEDANIIPLTRQILSALDKERGVFELIFVDDASTDGTWQRILEARQMDPHIRAIRLLEHGGKSEALCAGFRASRGKVIAMMDGDLQNKPADLPRMLAELESCDMVCGVRIQRMDGALRRFSSRVARVARRMVLGVDFRDSACGLHVFKRSMLEGLPEFEGMHRFMPILVQSAGGNVREIPVSHHPRVAGRSKYAVWNRLGRGLCDLLMVAWYRKRRLKNITALEHSD